MCVCVHVLYESPKRQITGANAAAHLVVAFLSQLHQRSYHIYKSCHRLPFCPRITLYIRMYIKKREPAWPVLFFSPFSLLAPTYIIGGEYIYIRSADVFSFSAGHVKL